MICLDFCCGQVVLLKDKKKVFTLDNLSYEPEAGALHPGGATAAVGGAVSTCLFTATWWNVIEMYKIYKNKHVKILQLVTQECSMFL